MSIQNLLCVQGPLQFIAGYVALKWISILQNNTSEDTLFIYDFLCPQEEEIEIVQVIYSLSGIQAWKNIIFCDSRQMKTLSCRTYQKSILELQAIVGQQHFDNIYLARDHTGFGSQLILNAYPESCKHQYGDSFGLVGQEDPDQMVHGVHHLKQQIKNFFLGKPKKISFDDMVLSIPIILSAYYSRSLNLIIPPWQFVTHLMCHFCNINPEFSAYCNNLLIEAKCHQCDLYLLSNLYASGLATFENELKLYTDIICANSKPGSILFIKPHPRSSYNLLSRLHDSLGAHYKVILLDNPKFSRLPIELYVNLLVTSKIYSILSASSIHVKYLYGIDVCLPLSDRLISKYILPDSVARVASIVKFIENALLNLDGWDGNSVLWEACSNNDKP